MKYNLLSDNELWELVSGQSDQAAYREVYLRYWKDVFMLAYKKLRDKEIAEELTQNLFVSLWEKRSEGAIRDLTSYLFGALKYSILNHYKEQLVHERYLSYLETKRDETDQATEELIMLKDLSAAIEKGMALLPPKTQQVFKLSRVEHHSVKEIAQRLNLSEKAVEYHITQSLKTIRVHLKDYLLFLLLCTLAAELFLQPLPKSFLIC